MFNKHTKHKRFWRKFVSSHNTIIKWLNWSGTDWCLDCFSCKTLLCGVSVPGWEREISLLAPPSFYLAKCTSVYAFMMIKLLKGEASICSSEGWVYIFPHVIDFPAISRFGEVTLDTYTYISRLFIPPMRTLRNVCLWNTSKFFFLRKFLATIHWLVATAVGCSSYCRQRESGRELLQRVCSVTKLLTCTWIVSY